MNKINYFNLYSLNFSRLADIKQQIATCEEESLKSQLEKALEATNIKAQAAKEKMLFTAMSSIKWGTLLTPSFGTETPKWVSEQLEIFQKTDRCIQDRLERFDGADPFLVQELVHDILGISQNTSPLFSDKARQHYFELMKQSGFLETDYAAINTA